MMKVSSVDGFFSIQPELLYIQKGGALKASEMGETLKIKETLNYIEMPLLAKVSFCKDAVKAYLNAGPSLGYALGGKYSFYYSGFGYTRDKEGKIKFGEEPANYNGDDRYYGKESVNRRDLGLQFGGGLKLKTGTGAFLLDVRYGLGLSNYNKENTTHHLKADGKNRALAVSLGYAIPLGGK